MSSKKLRSMLCGVLSFDVSSRIIAAIADAAFFLGVIASKNNSCKYGLTLRQQELEVSMKSSRASGKTIKVSRSSKNGVMRGSGSRSIGQPIFKRSDLLYFGWFRAVAQFDPV